MPNAYETAQAFRQALLARDAAAALRLTQAYGAAYVRLQGLLADLTAKIDKERAAGREISEAWLRRQERFQALMLQVNAELGQLAGTAAAEIETNQRAEGQRGLRDSATLMNQAATDAGLSTTFNQINSAAVENLVGALADGSPLKKVLRKYGRENAAVIEKTLIEGVTLGENPRKVARRMREAFGGNLTDALRVARTEQVRAYREASRQNYQANSDRVAGWIWVSSKSLRVCLACLSKDGQFYPLEKPQPSHINCRCTSYPLLKGQEPIQRTLGKDWFAAQPDDVQREMMGIKAHELYKAGKISLEDFEGSKTSAEWGEVTYQRSLKEILGDGGTAKAPRKPAGLSAAEARAKLSKVSDEFESEAKQARAKYDEAAKAELASAVAEDRMFDGKHYNEWRKIKMRLYDAEFEARDRFNEKAREVLYQSEPAEFTVKNQKLEKGWREGVESFRRLIGKGLLDKQEISFKKIRGRANYGLNNEVRVNLLSPAKDIVHELGHWLEDKNQDVFNAVTAFYERRTKGERLTSLPGYRSNEKGKLDKFINPYMGKYYEHQGKRYASEIVSMGLEYFHDRPVEFAQKDPDYFDFIYNLVRGNNG